MSYSNESVIKIIGGIGLCDIVFVLFLGLKLGKVIDWSWWWVTAPLWGQVVLALVGAVIALVVLVVCVIVKAIANSRK
jgi:hypothetical protein